MNPSHHSGHRGSGGSSARREFGWVSWVLAWTLSCIALALGLLAVTRSPIEVMGAEHPVVPRGDVTLSVRVFGTEPGDGGVAERALENARVRVLWELRPREFLEVASGSSDGQGAVRFNELPHGRGWVLVDRQGYQRASRPVALEGRRELTFRLDAARTLTAMVVDEEEQPIANATILVRDEDSLPFGAITGADGRATVSRLGPAPWKVQAFARRYESSSRDEVEGEVRFVLRRLGSIRAHVVTVEGDPAPGAHVLIVGSTLWPARRAVTDASGDALIAGLLPGVYDLKAQRGGHVSPTLSGLSLERGENQQVELRLAPGRMITVHVVDESPGYDAPIEKARVVAADHGLSSFPVSALTNDEGIAHVGPIEPGLSYLSVNADGFVGRSAVAVPPEQSEVRVLLLKGATLRGTVTDELGRPIDGARVEVIGTDIDGLPVADSPLRAAYQEAHFQSSLEPAALLPAGELGVTLGPVPLVTEALSGQPSVSGPPAWDELPSDYSPWVTDYEGEFVATPVSPGKLRALVRHPSYVEGVSEPVVVGPGGEAEVKVVLLQGGELEGRVVDESDRPVVDVWVSISATQGSFERSAITDVHGLFSFSAVPGEVTVSLARPAEPTRFVSRQVVRVPGGAKKEIELVLPEPRAPLVVVVQDGNGQAVELAEVQLTSLDVDVPLRVTRFSDSSGQVEIDDVKGLPARIRISEPRFVPWEKSFDEVPERIEVALEGGVLVNGRVTVVRGRRELGGARVSLRVGHRRDVAYTDSRGHYEFQNVPVGKVELEVTHDDYATEQRRLEVKETGRRDRAFEVTDIDLEEASLLSGKVLDREGNPVARARVGLMLVPAFVAAGQLPEGFVQTDDSGTFTLRGVAAGKHVLHAYAASFGRGQVEVEVGAGEEHSDLEIRLIDEEQADPLNLAGGSVALTLGERDTEAGVVVLVVNVAPGSEAERAGVLSGDRVRSVDDVSVRSMNEARARLNGRAGTDVLITVVRDGEELRYRVRREEVGR